MSGRASRAEPAAGRDRRAGGRGRTAARARARRRPAGDGARGAPAVRFRHDRIREAILGGLDPRRRRTLQLDVARRLAAVPELFAVAAEQYLPVVDDVDDPAERRVVVGLLRRAADQAALIGDYALVDALLAAALRLVDPADAATVVEVRTGRHAALFGLGAAGRGGRGVPRRSRSCARPRWTARTRRRCRCAASATAPASPRRSSSAWSRCASAASPSRPPDGFSAELDRQFDRLYRWLDSTDAADDLARPSSPTPRCWPRPV